MFVENLKISLNSVLPMFLIMAVGYLFRRIGWLGDAQVRPLNKVSLYSFIAVLLFCNIYQSDIKELLDMRLILFIWVYFGFEFGLSLAVTLLVEKDNHSRGALLHGMFRANTTLLGLPLAVAILGADNVGIISVVIAAIAPVLNVLGVLALEIFRGGKLNFKKLLIGICTSPLIIATILALIFNLGAIPIPAPIYSALNSMKAIASPLAMFLLGASFDFKTIGENAKNITIATIMKLIVIPAIAIIIAINMGFRGAALVAVMVCFSSPTAVMTFPMAVSADSNSELAANLVVFSSIFSSITLFITVFLFNTFNLI